MKILVTGGAGFIGLHLTKKLLALGYKVVCVDDLNNYYSPKIKRRNIAPFLKNKNYKFYRADICDYEKLAKIFKCEKIEKICHLAARAGVRPSIANPRLYEKVNVGGTMTLLDLAVKYKIKNFIFASSSSVYGNRAQFGDNPAQRGGNRAQRDKKIPFSESDPVNNPISPYAVTKKSGELLAATYHNLYGLNCTCLRLFTVYGPNNRPDMAPFLFTDLIFRGKPIKKFGDGASRRDYTYIDDIVEGIVAALEKNFSFEIINLGNNKPVELNYFIALIEQFLGKKAKIKQLPPQPGDVEITYADISKAKKMLGWQPKVKIEEGMKKFVEWYLEEYKNM